MIRKILALLFVFVLLAAVPMQAMAAGEGMHLGFQGGARSSWNQLDNDRMKARFTVTNTSADKTVKAFEMRVYATDENGQRIYGDSTYYYWTTKKEIAPGESAYSDYCTLPDRSMIHKVHAVVKKVIYTDGTQEEVADSALDYWDWTIVWDE